MHELKHSIIQTNGIQMHLAEQTVRAIGRGCKRCVTAISAPGHKPQRKRDS